MCKNVTGINRQNRQIAGWNNDVGQNVVWLVRGGWIDKAPIFLHSLHNCLPLIVFADIL
jgi:hypothetical protein